MAKNNLTPFEKAMKEALNEVPFNDSGADWNDLNHRLNQVQPATSSFPLKSLLIILGLIGLFTVVLFTLNGEQEPTLAENTTTANSEKLSHQTESKKTSSSKKTDEKLDEQPEADQNEAISSSQENSEESEVEEEIHPTTTSLNQEPLQEPNSDAGEITTPEENNSGVENSEEIIEEETEYEPLENIYANKAKKDEEEQPIFRKPSVVLSTQKACNGEMCLASLSSVKEDWVVTWYLSDGRTYRGASVQFKLQEEGALSVYAQIQSSKLATKTKAAQIEVLSVPTASIDWQKVNTANELIPYVRFRANQLGATSQANWNFGNSQNNTAVGEEVKHYYSSKGGYDVQLKVTNENGCVDSTQQMVVISESFNLLAPTSFSPNGDGLNDSWMPVTLTHPEYEFTLEILDKNNNLVFSTSDAYQPWDGTVNGSMVERGDIFFWRAFVNHKDEKKLVNEFAGRITISK